MTENGADRLAYYWNCIPIGKDNAITYTELCLLWRGNERYVRKILHDLSKADNGDDYILIRSGHGKGFYRTTDVHEIGIYKRECWNKAKSVAAPLVKINRIMRRENNVSERNKIKENA